MKMLDLYSYHTQPETLIGFENRKHTLPYLYTMLEGDSSNFDIQLLKASEAIIATNPNTTYLYATRVLKNKPFPLGEPSLVKDPQMTVFYVEDVYRSNTTPEKLLDIIASDPHSALAYASRVINGRWRQGEKAIATNALASLEYALYTSNQRFREGEEIIKNRPAGEYHYYVSQYNQKFGTDL